MAKVLSDIFWDVTPSSLVRVCQRSEVMLVTTVNTTWHHDPNSNWNFHFTANISWFHNLLHVI
jgi:hypothetical protein